MKKNLIVVRRFLIFSAPVIIAAAAIILVWIFDKRGFLNETASLTLYLSTVSLSLIFYLILLFKKREKEFERELKYLQTESEMAKEYYSVLECRMDDINKLRHELNNLISLIGGDEAEAFSELTKDIEDKTQELVRKKYCENKLLNIVISKKAAQAYNNKIDFRCNVIVSNDIAINEYDLCSCILNLLDNAIEVNSQDTELSDKWIELKAEVIGNYLVIRQTNSAPKKAVTDEKGFFKTSKKNSEFHGFGLKIIMDICNKYDGDCEFYQQDDVFYSTVSLKLNK